MNQLQQAEAFEQTLLSYAEMCYSVAFALTSDPTQAQDLARDVLTRAWRLCDRMDGKKDIKKKLLRELRKRFLQDYAEVPCPRRSKVSSY